MTRALLLAALLLPGCAARQSIPVAATADLVTTELALSRDSTAEGNPTLRSPAVRVSVKAAASVLLIWLSERLEKDGHHGSAKAVQWMATGLWSAAAAWNAHVWLNVHPKEGGR